MQLYLVRHGIALELGEQGVRKDSERCLSEEGRRKTADVGQGLKNLKVLPRAIVSSPLIRARETAEILAHELEVKGEIELSDLLMPGSDPMELTRWLKTRNEPVIMVVGHMPDLAEWVSVLLSGRVGVNVMFKKAAVACLTFDEPVAPGVACLEWLMQPAALRALRS